MKYPIGVQDFREIREKGMVYVDKTEYIYDIVENGKYFYLSRPRRFGKSLLISTIKELFCGSEELFDGLWIKNQWDWKSTNPVIWLKFALLDYDGRNLDHELIKWLKIIAKDNNVEINSDTLKIAFQELIHHVWAKHKSQVVILIDEYDKPIIDYLDQPERLETNRKILKNFYSVLKDSDPYIRLLFITGVGEFTKESIFSDLNNVQRLTLHPKSSKLLGITEEEIQHYFGDRLEQLASSEGLTIDELNKKIKHWYNGYSWDGKTKVFNPYSLLSLLESGLFHNYWFETGSPSFLIKEARKKKIVEIQQYKISATKLLDFDPERLNYYTLLFQTGYLTIKKYIKEFSIYVLEYPNKEVKMSYEERLLDSFIGNDLGALPSILEMIDSLENNNIDNVIQLLNVNFASIPYNLWQKENEGFFHALIHLTFSIMGAFVVSEMHSSHGRSDTVIKTKNYVYVFEFKLNQTAEIALKQIVDKCYFAPYIGEKRKVYGIGINFSSEKKQITDWCMKESQELLT